MMTLAASTQRELLLKEAGTDPTGFFTPKTFQTFKTITPFLDMMQDNYVERWDYHRFVLQGDKQNG